MWTSTWHWLLPRPQAGLTPSGTWPELGPLRVDIIYGRLLIILKVHVQTLSHFKLFLSERYQSIHLVMLVSPPLKLPLGTARTPHTLPQWCHWFQFNAVMSTLSQDYAIGSVHVKSPRACNWPILDLSVICCCGLIWLYIISTFVWGGWIPHRNHVPSSCISESVVVYSGIFALKHMEKVLLWRKIFCTALSLNLSNDDEMMKKFSASKC